MFQEVMTFMSLGFCCFYSTIFCRGFLCCNVTKSFIVIFVSPINLNMSLSYQQRYKNSTFQMPNILFPSSLRHLHLTSYLATCDLLKLSEYCLTSPKCLCQTWKAFLPFLASFLDYLHYIIGYNII